MAQLNTLQVVPPRGFFVPLPGSLQNQSQILLMLQENKALPEGGQRLNSKKTQTKTGF